MSGEKLDLLSSSLHAIANGVDQLSKTTVKVTYFELHGVRVYVRREDSQRDGCYYVVERIERTEK